MNEPDPKTINNTLSAAWKALADSHYAKALGLLRKAAAPWPAQAAKAEALEGEFFYMLRFLASGHAVEKPEQTLAGIAARADILARSIQLELIADTESTVLSGILRYMRMRPEENIQSLVSDYLAEQDRLATDTAAITDPKRRAGLERISTDIFNRLWCTFPLDSDTATLILSVITDDSIAEQDRTLWTNALGLAYHSFPTDDQAELLLQICQQSSSQAIKAAATAWLLLGLHVDAKRKHKALASTAVAKRLDATGLLPALITSEWARSLTTANLGLDFRNISGQVNKLGKRFLDKLRADNDENITPERLMELTDGIDANQFEDIKRFNEAQLNGADVFMATIGRMRHYDFFRTPANWFLPFDSWHSALAEVTEADGAAIADTMARINTLCDSDKYAVMLSLGQVPTSMRRQALEGMSSQLMTMTQSDEFAEALGAIPTDETAAANAIKNIYRFFNVFENRSEFTDTLAEWPGEELTAFLHDDNAILKIAGTLYGARCFGAAADCYLMLTARGTELGRGDTEKLAASLASSHRYDKALEHYSNILKDYPDGDNRAVRMNMARIYLLTGRPGEAADVMRDGIANNSDNAPYIALAAEAIVAAGRWKDAAELYYMLDYASTDNSAEIKTDLAWALTVNGELDDADAVFDAIDAAPAPALLRRRAILYWLMNKNSDALKMASQIAPEADDEPDELYKLGHEYLLAHSPYSGAVRLYDEALHYLRTGSTFGNLI